MSPPLGARDLRRNVKEAVVANYFDYQNPPAAIRLHLVRD